MAYGGSFFQSNTAPTISPSNLARNGDSIDGTGAVVLGQDVGAAGNPAAFLNDRELVNAGFQLFLMGVGNLLLNKAINTGEKLQLVGGFLADNGFSAKIRLDPLAAGNIDIITANGTITINGNSAVITLATDNIRCTINGPGHFDVFTGVTVLMRVLGTGNVMINSVVDNGKQLQVNGSISQNDTAAMLHASTAMTNGAAAAAGTLLNAPAAGNPTKWIPFDDAGVTRFIPAW